jgi:large subunit ribosomal protein L25
MKQFKLNIVNRENTGRGVARRLRAEGNIPACVYSKGNSRSISLSVVDFRDLKRSIGGGAALIELVDDKGETALVSIQEVQRNAFKNCINHIDFLEVARGESFVAQVPVHLINTAEAVGVRLDGGIVDHKTHSVEIRCRPSKLPDHVEVDVKDLGVGDALHISQLPAIEGVEYLGNPIQVIVSIQAPTVAVEKTEESDEAVAADEVPASKVSADDAE